MLSRIIPAALFVVILTCIGASPPQVHAAPLWQLPWPTGHQQKMDGGNSYGCGDHTGMNQFAIDFWFDPVVSGQVSAVASGTVSASTFNTLSGWYVDVDHGGGYVSIYSDLVGQGPSAGTFVSQGQVIGTADSSGSGSTGNHLHFRILLNGAAFQPEPMSGVTGFGSYGLHNYPNCGNTVSSWWMSSPPQVQNLTLNCGFDEPNAICDTSACPWHRINPPGGTTIWEVRSSPTPVIDGTKFLRFSSTVAGRQRTVVDPPADERAHASIWES
jgi:hypothetical protein